MTIHDDIGSQNQDTIIQERVESQFNMIINYINVICRNGLMFVCCVIILITMFVNNWLVGIITLLCVLTFMAILLGLGFLFYITHEILMCYNRYRFRREIMHV